MNMLNDDDTKYIDPDTNMTFRNYKTYKQTNLIIDIYNNSDKKKLELLNNMELEEKKLKINDQ